MADVVAVDTILRIQFFRSQFRPETIPQSCRTCPANMESNLGREDLWEQATLKASVEEWTRRRRTLYKRDVATACSVSSAIWALAECKRTPQRQTHDGRPLFTAYMSDGYDSSWRELCSARLHPRATKNGSFKLAPPEPFAWGKRHGT